MRLREYQTYLRWTCGRDIVNDGTLADWVDRLEARMDAPFARWLPLDRPASPSPWHAGVRLDQLDGRCGAGQNQQVRMRLIADENAAGIVHFDVQATMHPYTGRYVAACELRLRQSVFESPTQVLDWVKQLEAWVEEGDVLCAHIHDADDDAIQNTSSVGMLKLGYGIDVDAVDLPNNPGRETSRGELRYVVNWLSFFGAEMLDALHVPDDVWSTLAADGIAVRREDKGVWLQLSASPLDPDAPATRARQAQVRELLGIKAFADRQRRAFGYWQKK